MAPVPSRRQSAALTWPAIARFIAADARLAAWAQDRGPLAVFLYEFARFGVKQA
ncbi:hypothetical protein FHS85_002762 [Rhodoligotrophos appendicifer]